MRTLTLGLGLSVALAAAPAMAGDTYCNNKTLTGYYDNVIVNGQCTLEGATVKGNVKVVKYGDLTMTATTVYGNVQGEYAKRIEVVDDSYVGGDIQAKYTRGTGQSGIGESTVGGNIQLEENGSYMTPGWVIAGNMVDGDVQVFKNRSSSPYAINGNFIGGNLQCKENNPRPTGADNEVDGNKEDQCRRF